MAYATDHSTHGRSAFAGIVAAFRERSARRRLYKDTLRELNSLSSRELSDLGLHRSMIRRIAYQAAYSA
ncbi:DUF1127 domain-containing protein [Salipiger pallidus]|nr:DUF1127 domain-containing protein [Salipiger pallidus]